MDILGNPFFVCNFKDQMMWVLLTGAAAFQMSNQSGIQRINVGFDVSIDGVNFSAIECMEVSKDII
jgi:hypothetical protein